MSAIIFALTVVAGVFIGRSIINVCRKAGFPGFSGV